VNAPETYRKWAQKYGPVFQIMLGNEPVVVINSAKAAYETFLSQGNAMSSRPMFYTFHKVCISSR
jgi:3-hydroxyphenylacetate 6-hydroxylase